MKKALVVMAMFISVFVGGLAVPPTASAAVASGCSSNFLGLPAWYKYLDVGPKDGDPCAITGPTQDDGSGDFDLIAALPLVGLAIVEILTRIAALVSVGFVIYGGFRYITSQGEPEATKAARQTITNSLIGLVISMIATASVAFIASRLS